MCEKQRGGFEASDLFSVVECCIESSFEIDSIEDLAVLGWPLLRNTAGEYLP